jgi:hypothetical protein
MNSASTTRVIHNGFWRFRNKVMQNTPIHFVVIACLFDNPPVSLLVAIQQLLNTPSLIITTRKFSTIFVAFEFGFKVKKQ